MDWSIFEGTAGSFMAASNPFVQAPKVNEKVQFLFICLETGAKF